MKRVIVVAVMLTLVLAFGTVVAAKEQHAGGIFNHCVSSSMGRWNTFEIANRCNEDLTVTYGVQGSGRAGYALDIASGETKNTGLSNASAQGRGLSIAACRAGYQPLNGSGGDWVPGGQYRCVQMRY
jgi:hypothetical protein